MTEIAKRQLGDDMHGVATVEYLAAACVTAFLCWAAMSAFGQAAIQGLKLAGLDLLGLS
jgi:hypothetical protein